MRRKLQERKEAQERLKITHQQASEKSEDGTNVGGSDVKSHQPRFGTQLVHYHPDLVEVSQQASANVPRDDDDEEYGPLSAFKQTTAT